MTLFGAVTAGIGLGVLLQSMLRFYSLPTLTVFSVLVYLNDVL